ncbi:MobA/MobL family protein [Xenorhabdus bovienii]|uniref:MobA/MobL family protein n=2 Tax=Xenorhabdus bovienii TaxID=40576 RepID=UPI0023B30FA4|nr:MobA/MobL family protein [Xenorhabdus bovienii]MDE9504066.1 MobA/MobL family protein [Xenorhabdus bovienii]MDE9527825.1 MobA/MobL family protein [Xenorhabdus bovienii]MDE9571000.1 MobA/MobL family protein [Xenorhabdus bovienii]MDE9590173.1 MobA/MobL family protein [Xenorhabdus bovienii]
MASYHLSVKTGGKGNASPHADYIAREDKYAREKNSDLEHKESGNMPAWAAHKPSEFWKAADTFERANGCTYREIEIALPRELNPEQRLALVRDFVQQEIGDRHAYQFAIHNPKAAIDGGEQPHAHIMFSERLNDGIDRDPPQYFKRANSKDPERGGAKKVRFGETPTERKEYLSTQRVRWAELQNHYLERYQHPGRVDACSLKAQGIERHPERHLGVGQVRKLDAVQLQAVIERREAERQAQICREERNNVIDVTTSLREALAERDNQAEKHNHQPVQEMIQGRTFNFEQEPEKLDSLVDDALKDIQDDIDLQSLINDSMAEFQGIHQEMVRQQERSVLAEKQRQQEKEWLRIAEQQRQKPDKGWSFSR